MGSPGPARGRSAGWRRADTPPSSPTLPTPLVPPWALWLSWCPLPPRALRGTPHGPRDAPHELRPTPPAPHSRAPTSAQGLLTVRPASRCVSEARDCGGVRAFHGQTPPSGQLPALLDPSQRASKNRILQQHTLHRPPSLPAPLRSSPSALPWCLAMAFRCERFVRRVTGGEAAGSGRGRLRCAVGPGPWAALREVGVSTGGLSGHPPPSVSGCGDGMLAVWDGQRRPVEAPRLALLGAAPPSLEGSEWHLGVHPNLEELAELTS